MIIMITMIRRRVRVMTVDREGFMIVVVMMMRKIMMTGDDQV